MGVSHQQRLMERNDRNVMSVIKITECRQTLYCYSNVSSSSSYDPRWFPLVIRAQCKQSEGCPPNHTMFHLTAGGRRLHGVCLPFGGWMCRCPEMESYEEFCLRSLAILQEVGKFKKKTCEPLWTLKACSVIRFHGRAVLSPLVRKEGNYPKGLK